jgi:exodeoxyribonuclease VII large subunit
MLRRIERDRREFRACARALPSAENLFAIPRRMLDEAGSRLGRALVANTQIHRTLLTRAAARLAPANLLRQVDRCGERIKALADKSARAIERRIERRQERLAALDQLLRSLSYESILARGYAVVRDAADVPIADAAAVSNGMRLDIQFRDGRVQALATSDARPKPKKPREPSGSQGSLF